MRRTVIRQLTRYLMAAWIIGVITLTLLTYVSHGAIQKCDLVTIVGTAAFMGGIFYNLVDVCKFEEKRGENRRQKHNGMV